MALLTPRADEDGQPLAQVELAVYEALRAGRRDAFTRLAVALDPVLRDLAGTVIADDEQVGALVRHTWEVALPGLDLFAWRCSLRAWVAGVLVAAIDRPAPGGPPPATGGGPAAQAPATGGGPAAQTPATGGAPRRRPPLDWADLPWGARWSESAVPALARTQAALPLVARLALVLRDGHGWDDRDACDTLGLTEVRYREVLALARLALHDALAALAGDPLPACAHDRAAVVVGGSQLHDCPSCATLRQRLERVGTVLAATAARPPQAPDRALLAVFRRWRAAHRRGLRWWLARRRLGALALTAVSIAH